ncbi:MAG: hypothetical protein DHS20C15_25420 [Planctomycetota bacterium]|nr:MAG: hypothetical protein DHS20C15_25420 [Planctomycetota bacterium]
MPVVNSKALAEERVAALAEYHRSTGIARAELDVSGGVDSAVMLALLARALGPQNVCGVFIGIHSHVQFLERARESAAAAGVALVEFDATELFDKLSADMRTALLASGRSATELDARLARDRTVLGSIRSCLRAPIGRGFNRMTGGGVRHGTGNECEDRFIRFYQKGGDGEVDSNPIAMLSKGEVFQLAREVGVPRSILTALPSPDLHGIGEAHNDEDELREATGVHWTYSKVDPDTGAYTYVGSIERMARFLDTHPEVIGEGEPEWGPLVAAAHADLFKHLATQQDVRALLASARALEASTRHKVNPNCPTLGTRQELLDAGLLSDDLPEV